jgi:crotonobetainyl-CoA:carnitine CoA-transferase CaiB-like acyl-CoA transferase
LDIAMSESMIPSIADAFMDYFMNGRISLTMGNRHRSAAPCGCYRCRGEDKWVSIQVSSDQDWQGLCRALGNPPWTKEARFADALSRWRNQDELDKLIEGWTLQHDHYEVTRILQKEGVPAGPVLDESEVFSDPHIKERGFFQELTQEDAGTHLYPGLLWRMADTPNTIRRPPVRLGEHNEYVYRQLLKVSEEEYADIARDGHIGTEYGPGV